jgi:hypothetical protein
MENIDNVVQMVRTRVEAAGSGKTTIYRYDLFKGAKDSSGTVTKIKSIGNAYIREGLKTYTVHLKTFLKDTFYLLQNTNPRHSNADYVILTRELAQHSGKKYFWSNVGEGRVLEGPNHGLMHLAWDVFLSDDIYMTLHPINVSEVPEAARLASEAA